MRNSSVTRRQCRMNTLVGVESFELKVHLNHSKEVHVTGRIQQAGQRRRPRVIGGCLVVVCLLLGLARAGSAEVAGAAARPNVNSAIPSYTPAPDIAGNFVIAGSDTMQPLLLQLASRFRQLYPNGKIAVQTQGTERGFKQFISDQAQIRRGDGFYSGQQVSGSAAVLASSRELTPRSEMIFPPVVGKTPTEGTAPWTSP